MRYIIKGGVWKNCEDEILKAAVMKYGLNQWSRISSLLIRKSAKQCKQRWYEWLDPQIKKTEWTREEDEKLLHLAKIFPCQWRTISPIVNRTPNQCVERYERLLDIAQGKNPDDPNDPRKLKPGEIDPNPETKPAKVDQIDMDEDQKEMLAEARVRLANTMGKKPKRLAREKLIEDARRQAQLQKRTELKAAGIELLGKRKSKAMNYNAEIPFERVPTQHVFKVTKDETPAPKMQFQNLSLRDIEGKMRIDEEENKRKIDEKRMKMLTEKNLGQVVDKISRQTKEMLTQKSKLILPGVQLTDKDLELLGKQNTVSALSGADNEITKGLMGNYTQMTPTPMRTPRMQDSILTEAMNLVALNQTKTPLLGGHNAELIDADKLFAKPANPVFKVPQTPNQLKKMLDDQTNNQLFAAPQSKKRLIQAQTPLRDEFNLNDKARVDMETSSTWEHQQIPLDAEDSQLMAKQTMEQLRSRLLNLPKPQFEYGIEVPELEDEEDQERMKKIDAQEEFLIEQQNQIQLKQKQQRLHSLSITKRLPRPFQLPTTLYDHIYNRQDISDFRREAEQMLESETIQLLAFDQQNFPFQGSKPSHNKVSIQGFDEAEILNASEIINKEMAAIKSELKQTQVDQDFIYSKWRDSSNSIQFNRSLNRPVDLRSSNLDIQKDLLRQQAERNKLIVQRDQKRIEQQLFSKARISLTGFLNIISKNSKETEDLLQNYSDLKIESDVFSRLQQQEMQSIAYRMEESKNYFNNLTLKEKELQEKYDRLELLRYQLTQENQRIAEGNLEEEEPGFQLWTDKMIIDEENGN